MYIDHEREPTRIRELFNNIQFSNWTVVEFMLCSAFK